MPERTGRATLPGSIGWPVRLPALTQIDHFVATHWHGDHYAGATRVHQRIPIRNFYDRGFPSESDYAAKGDLKRAKEGIAKYRETTQGGSRTLKPGDEIALRQSAGQPKVGAVLPGLRGRVSADKRKLHSQSVLRRQDAQTTG